MTRAIQCGIPSVTDSEGVEILLAFVSDDRGNSVLPAEPSLKVLKKILYVLDSH
jgi:hypothetical protein